MTIQSSDRSKRQQVSLRKITTNTDVFQFRHLQIDQHHVDELTAVLRNGNILDRLTLWLNPETGEHVVVDGHHRLAAYKQASWRKKVPVVVHRCEIDQARLMALKENVKTRLPMTPDERSDAAWRLVCLGPEAYSKSTIAKAAGPSERTVAKMRSVYRALLERDPDEVLPLQWWQAMAILKEREQREYTEDERDAMIEAKVAQLDAEIGKALGYMAAHQPEAAIVVVAKRLGRQGLKLLWEECEENFDPYDLNELEDEEEV